MSINFLPLRSSGSRSIQRPVSHLVLYRGHWIIVGDDPLDGPKSHEMRFPFFFLPAKMYCGRFGDRTGCWGPCFRAEYVEAHWKVELYRKKKTAGSQFLLSKLFYFTISQDWVIEIGFKYDRPVFLPIPIIIATSKLKTVWFNFLVSFMFEIEWDIDISWLSE